MIRFSKVVEGLVFNISSDVLYVGIGRKNWYVSIDISGLWIFFFFISDIYKEGY